MGRHARSVAAPRPALAHNLSAAVAAGCVALCVALSLPAVAATISSARMGAPSQTTPTQPHPAAHGVSTPAWFEPNVGQDASRAPFIARLGGGDSMAISATQTTMTVGSGATRSQVGLDLVGASSTATIAGADRQSGIANYFTGNRSQWHTDVPMYGQVVTENAYPGIDLVWRSTEAGAEYDFHVAPNANASAIDWHVSGATSLRIDRNGALVIGTASGTITEQAPHAYQVVNGTQQLVPSRFVVQGDTVRFAVGPYDHARPLVIDPALAFSTYFPGHGFGSGYAVRLDAAGNAYVLNDGSVSKFSPSGAVLYSSTLAGGASSLPQTWHGLAVDAAGDAFVVNRTSSIAELDPTGSQLLYSASLPSASVTAVALGPGTTVYVTGTSPGGLPTTAGAFQASNSPATTFTSTAFIAKIDPSLAGDGTGTLSTANPQLLYSTYVGTEFLANYDSNIAFPDIVVDSQGNAYISGMTNDTSYPVTAGAFQQPPASGFTGPAGANPDAAFVSELSPSGNGSADLLYSTLLYGATPDSTNQRGQAVDQAFGLTLGPSMSTGGPATIYVVGATGAADFPVTTSAVQRNPSTCNLDFVMCDAFYSRINPIGGGASDLVYSTYLGGSLNEAAFDVTADAAGHAFVTGFTWSPDFPVTSNAIQPAKCCPTSPFQDVFVTELDPTASGQAGLLFSTYLGGSGSEWGNGIAVSGNGNVFVTGYTDSPATGLKKVKPVDFPVTVTPTGKKKRIVFGHGFFTIISGLS